MLGALYFVATMIPSGWPRPRFQPRIGWLAHEATGDLIEHFLSLLVVAVLHIASCLIALLVGGVEGHWGPAMVFVAFATAAAVSGASIQTIGWKPGAIILAVEVLTWLLLA